MMPPPSCEKERRCPPLSKLSPGVLHPAEQQGEDNEVMAEPGKRPQKNSAPAHRPQLEVDLTPGTLFQPDRPVILMEWQQPKLGSQAIKPLDLAASHDHDGAARMNSHLHSPGRSHTCSPSPATTSSSSSPSAPCPASTAVQACTAPRRYTRVGETISWEVVAQIGKGGYGKVFLCKEVQHSGQQTSALMLPNKRLRKRAKSGSPPRPQQACTKALPATPTALNMKESSSSIPPSSHNTAPPSTESEPSRQRHMRAHPVEAAPIKSRNVKKHNVQDLHKSTNKDQTAIPLTTKTTTKATGIQDQHQHQHQHQHQDQHQDQPPLILSITAIHANLHKVLSERKDDAVAPARHAPNPIEANRAFSSSKGTARAAEMDHQAKNNPLLCAIKVEALREKRSSTLEHEERFYQRLKATKHVVPTMLFAGRSQRFKYTAFELLGKNLNDLRRKQSTKCFDLPSTVFIAQQTLRCLQCLHEHGILHRDVKPSNFAVGNAAAWKRIYIFDFGLATTITRNTASSSSSKEGSVKPLRKRCRFVGTARYASCNTQQGQPQCFRDDMTSWLYMLVELHIGTLPWKDLKDRKEILESKLAHPWKSLFSLFPPMFMDIAGHISGHNLDDAVDYDFIRRALDAFVSPHIARCPLPLLNWTKRCIMPTGRIVVRKSKESPPDNCRGCADGILYFKVLAEQLGMADEYCAAQREQTTRETPLGGGDDNKDNNNKDDDDDQFAPQKLGAKHPCTPIGTASSQIGHVEKEDCCNGSGQVLLAQRGNLGGTISKHSSKRPQPKKKQLPQPTQVHPELLPSAMGRTSPLSRRIAQSAEYRAALSHAFSLHKKDEQGARAPAEPVEGRCHSSEAVEKELQTSTRLRSNATPTDDTGTSEEDVDRRESLAGHSTRPQSDGSCGKRGELHRTGSAALDRRSDAERSEGARDGGAAICPRSYTSCDKRLHPQGNQTGPSVIASTESTNSGVVQCMMVGDVQLDKVFGAFASSHLRFPAPPSRPARAPRAGLQRPWRARFARRRDRDEGGKGRPPLAEELQADDSMGVESVHNREHVVASVSPTGPNSRHECEAANLSSS